LPVTGVSFSMGVSAVPSGGRPALQTVGRSLPTSATTNADTVVFRTVFSESVSGVDAADFVPTGALAGSATVLGVQVVNATTRDVTVGGAGLAAANGTLGLGLAASPSITDSASQTIDTTFVASSMASYTLDNTAPTATVATSTGGHDGVTSFTVTFSFSESVNGLTASDFAATNATLSNFEQLTVSGTTTPTNQYRLTVTPSAVAAITVSLAAGAATDDAGNASAAASLTVQAGPTITGPASSTGATAAVSVAENTASVFTFTANIAVTCLDFEARSTYSVRVRSTDQGGLTVEKQFAISVTDVNEAPTAVALANTTISLAENTSTSARIKVADIVVTDDALGTEAITLTGADAASFEVDGLALYLKAGVTLNFEAKASYAVTANVADTSLSGSTPVTVGLTLSVTDVNEAPVDIALSASSLAENAGANAVVGNLSSTDADAGNTFTYTLVSGTGDTDNATFNVSAGQLRATASLDFEARSTYSVRVRST
ncbi:MAG: hypothetical protein EB018_11420, partial [Gammaproteobacteria bacterium]|nr:hypothetical protein [Gammaproteobacteria bacterium]